MSDGSQQNKPGEPKLPDLDGEPQNVDLTIRHIPRVLIIEDAVELGEMLKLTLEQMRLIVTHESHGTRALERYKQLRPDLVLLDIGLPDMTGWKVLDAIKELKAVYKRPGIIVMTAYGDPANRLMGKLQGVEEYLIKPFTTEELRRLVGHVLGIKVDKKP